MPSIHPALSALLVVLASGAATAADFRLDNAEVVGSGNQITITRLPVVSGNTILYRDVTLQFGLGAGGRLTILPGYPKTTASAPLLTGALTPGRYLVHGFSPDLVFRLIGPSTGAGNRAMWSLTGETVAQQMNFYVGPTAGHPLQKRIQRAGITYSGQAFGTTSRNTSLDGWYFDERQLVAIQPLGHAISLMSYSFKGADATYPLRTITLFPCSATTCK